MTIFHIYIYLYQHLIISCSLFVYILVYRLFFMKNFRIRHLLGRITVKIRLRTKIGLNVIFYSNALISFLVSPTTKFSSDTYEHTNKHIDMHIHWWRLKRSQITERQRALYKTFGQYCCLPAVRLRCTGNTYCKNWMEPHIQMDLGNLVVYSSCATDHKRPGHTGMSKNCMM